MLHQPHETFSRGGGGCFGKWLPGRLVSWVRSVDRTTTRASPDVVASTRSSCRQPSFWATEIAQGPSARHRWPRTSAAVPRCQVVSWQHSLTW